MSTSALSRVIGPIVGIVLVVGVMAFAGSAGASKPGWYNYPSIGTGSNTVGTVRTGGIGALQCDPLCTEQGPNPEYAGVFFQWLQCHGPHGGGRAAPPGGLQDEGGPCPGATVIRAKSKAAGANNYTLQASDIGKWVQMEIIAVNYDCSYPRSDGWQECRYSEAHAWTQSVGPVVAAGPPPPPPPPPAPIAVGPTYTALPAITGEFEDMQTLTVSNGTWNGTQPLSFAYQWLQCSKKNAGCKPIEGATASTYTLTSADVATRITASVTVRNAGGSFTAAAKLTPKIAGAKPRPGRDSLDVTQLLPRHRLKVQSVTWSPQRLRPGGRWVAKVTVVDARGFLIRGVAVEIEDELGDVTSTPTLTNARGVATLRLRTTRFVPLGRLALTVTASKPETADAVETLTTSKRISVTVRG